MMAGSIGSKTSKPYKPYVGTNCLSLQEFDLSVSTRQFKIIVIAPQITMHCYQ